MDKLKRQEINPPNKTVPELSTAALEAVAVGDGVDCTGDERVDELEEELIEMVAEGNVRVGDEDARLQNSWASFS